MKLFSLLGTGVVLHWTIVVPFLIVARSPTNLAFMAIIFVVVLLHEFGHILACRMYGNDCKKVILSALGGMAFLEREAEKPSEELVVAVCGPLVNVVLFAACVPFVGGELNFWSLVLIANAFIVIFNIIPAYPMDGGRMLRALIWFFTPHRTATLICAVVSVLLASAGVVAGSMHGQWNIVLISVVIGAIASSEFFTLDNTKKV